MLLKQRGKEDLKAFSGGKKGKWQHQHRRLKRRRRQRPNSGPLCKEEDETLSEIHILAAIAASVRQTDECLRLTKSLSCRLYSLSFSLLSLLYPLPHVFCSRSYSRTGIGLRIIEHRNIEADVVRCARACTLLVSYPSLSPWQTHNISPTAPTTVCDLTVFPSFK